MLMFLTLWPMMFLSGAMSPPESMMPWMQYLSLLSRCAITSIFGFQVLFKATAWPTCGRTSSASWCWAVACSRSRYGASAGCCEAASGGGRIDTARPGDRPLMRRWLDEVQNNDGAPHARRRRAGSSHADVGAGSAAVVNSDGELGATLRCCAAGTARTAPDGGEPRRRNTFFGISIWARMRQCVSDVRTVPVHLDSQAL